MSAADPDPPSAAGRGVPFHLVPWAVDQGGSPAAFSITGRLARQGRDLSIHYLLRGPMDQLALPRAAPRPERRDELWRGTCLEFFLAPRGEEPCWEYNLSPAGHWNVYRFGGYRSGMVEEPGYATLPFQVVLERDRLTLDLRCALPPALPADQPLALGVCAVIAPRHGELSYWALVHPGRTPDFHLREGFRLLI